MFTKVVVGVDLETRGRDAIALGRRLLADDGELVFAYVHPGYALTVKGPSEAFEVVEEEDAKLFLASVRDEHGLRAKVRAIGSASVGPALHRVVDEEEADLLVVGSTRRGIIGRVLVGNHTAEALNGASCAVAVAPAGYAESAGRIATLGVGFDGGDESVDALAVARGLATELHARVSACTVVSPARYGSVMDVRESAEVAREYLSHYATDLDVCACVGDPGEELAVFSGSVDLLVIGSRSYGPIGRLVHGATERRLLRSARSALLVVPRALRIARERQQAGAELAQVP